MTCPPKKIVHEQIEVSCKIGGTNCEKESIYRRTNPWLLREVAAGMKVADACRKHAISDATYYNWKVKYEGMTLPDIKR